MPRSLVIVKGDMYTRYLHGIRETTTDLVDETYANLDSCGPSFGIGSLLQRSRARISLTVRVVPKVLQNRLLFGRK